MLKKAGFAAISGVVLGVVAFVLWLRHETPHFKMAAAVRESPLVQARSLKAPLTAFGPKKAVTPLPVVEMVPPTPAPAVTANQGLPVWLMQDAPEFAETKNTRLSPGQTLEQLRQSLRESGARQMGKTVRFAILNLAELLAMEPKEWEASLATPAASENRASAMLLTFYLCYLDRAGDSAGVTALRQAMEKGMPEERAVREFILAGRSVAEVESEMGRVFADAGVELQFTRRGGAVFRP